MEPTIAETPEQETPPKEEDEVLEEQETPPKEEVLEEEKEGEAEEEEPEPAPKRRGRPVGSKSKIPGKPRAKKAVKKVLVPEQSFTKDEAEEPEQDTRNRPLAGSRPIPTEAHDATSARIISLLQTQMQVRKTRKVQLWKSWFR